MRPALFILLTICALSAQQTTTYTFDANGRRVEGARIDASKGPGVSERRETVRNVNGRRVPLESTEEKVISDSGGVRVVERVYRRFDENGQPGPPEKARIEERTNPDGSSSISTTIYRGDINGNLALYERRKTETSKVGDRVNSTTLVERAGVNGGIEPTERVEEVQQLRQDGTGSSQSTIQRRDANGRFFDWQRQSSERKLDGGAMVENTVVYGAVEHTGMQMLRQTVARTSKDAVGGQTVELQVFDSYDPGRAKAAGPDRPQLREVQVIERTPTAGGSTETVSIRRPLPSDPGKLGPAHVISQTQCAGDCK